MGAASPASFGAESQHSAWRPAGAEPISELRFGARLSQALCTDHLTEFSQQPHNIGVILVPILHTGKQAQRGCSPCSHSHSCKMIASVFNPGATWTPEPALWWFSSHLLWVSSTCGSLPNLVSLEMKVTAKHRGHRRMTGSFGQQGSSFWHIQCFVLFLN